MIKHGHRAKKRAKNALRRIQTLLCFITTEAIVQAVATHRVIATAGFASVFFVYVGNVKVSGVFLK